MGLHFGGAAMSVLDGCECGGCRCERAGACSVETGCECVPACTVEVPEGGWFCDRCSVYFAEDLPACPRCGAHVDHVAGVAR